MELWFLHASPARPVSYPLVRRPAASAKHTHAHTLTCKCSLSVGVADRELTRLNFIEIKSRRGMSIAVIAALLCSASQARSVFVAASHRETFSIVDATRQLGTGQVSNSVTIKHRHGRIDCIRVEGTKIKANHTPTEVRNESKRY